MEAIFQILSHMSFGHSAEDMIMCKKTLFLSCEAEGPQVGGRTQKHENRGMCTETTVRTMGFWGRLFLAGKMSIVRRSMDFWLDLSIQTAESVSVFYVFLYNTHCGHARV